MAGLGEMDNIVNSINGRKVSADHMLTQKSLKYQGGDSILSFKFNEAIVLFTPRGVRVSKRSDGVYDRTKGEIFSYNVVGDLWLPFSEPLPWLAKLTIFGHSLCSSVRALDIQCE